MIKGWIVAESLQLSFFRSTKLPQAFSQMYHDGELDTQEATRLLQCSVWVEMGYLKHSKKIRKDISTGDIWTYLDISGHGKHMETFQKLLTPVRPSPELMQEFHGFHTLCMACGADHFSAFCQVMSSVSTHVVQECSGHSRTKMIKMSSFKFLRSSTAWTSWKTNGRKHPWPLGRRRPKVFPNCLPKSPGSETTGSSWKSPAGISDDQAKQLGIDDVDIDDLGGQGQMCPAKNPNYQKADDGRIGRWWSDDNQIITVWLNVTDECRADANSVILRQFCASHFSAHHVDVRMSENEAFLAHHSSLAQEYEEGTTKQARSATSVTSPRIIIFLATSHSKVEHVVLVSSQDPALVFYPWWNRRVSQLSSLARFKV